MHCKHKNVNIQNNEWQDVHQSLKENLRSEIKRDKINKDSFNLDKHAQILWTKNDVC
jgi:hypothetical protein